MDDKKRTIKEAFDTVGKLFDVFESKDITEEAFVKRALTRYPESMEWMFESLPQLYPKPAFQRMEFSRDENGILNYETVIDCFADFERWMNKKIDDDQKSMILGMWAGTTVFSDIALFSTLKLFRTYYKFDQDFLKYVEKTTFPGGQPLPVNLLRRTPLPAFLINISPTRLEAAEDEGLYTYVAFSLVHSPKEGLDQMHLKFIDIQREGKSFTMWTVLDDEPFEVKVRKMLENTPDSTLDWDLTIAALSRVLNQLLYLVSQKPDVDREPSLPQYRKIKGGKRHFPGEPQEVNVGVKYGNFIRNREKDAEQRVYVRREGEPAYHLPPHVRPAHWQGYWYGRRNRPEERHIEVLWKAPIWVNAEYGEIAPTIKEVKT